MTKAFKQLTANTDYASLVFFLVGLSLVLLTASLNLGFIAIDDYANHLPLMLPVHLQPNWVEVASSGIHPPFPKVFFMSLIQVAEMIGIQSASGQFRWTLIVIGVFSLLVNVLSVPHFYRGRRQVLGVALLGLFFLCPLMMSRLMAESVAMPLMTLSTALLVSYWRIPRVRILVLAMIVFSVAFVFRPQVISVAPVFILVVALQRRWKDLCILVGGAVAACGVVGALDLLFGRTFFASYSQYVFFNLKHSSADHGVMPFYVYVFALMGLSLPPTLFSRYIGFDFKKECRSIFPALTVLACFVGVHSLIGHKEERFMVPILGVFLLSLVPLLDFLFFEKKSYVRAAYFIVLNVVLLFFTSFSVVQNNIVSLALFLEKTPTITELIQKSGSLVVFPLELVGRPLKVIAVNESQMGALFTEKCHQMLVIRKDLLESRPVGWKQTAEFSPGLLERIVIFLNPRHNLRRTAIETFIPEKCLNSAAFGDRI